MSKLLQHRCFFLQQLTKFFFFFFFAFYLFVNREDQLFMHNGRSYNLEGSGVIQNDLVCINFTTVEENGKARNVQEDFRFCDREATSWKEYHCPFSSCKLAIVKEAQERTTDITTDLLDSKVCKDQIEWISPTQELEFKEGNPYALIVAGHIINSKYSLPFTFCKYDGSLGYAFSNSQSSGNKINICITPDWLTSSFERHTSNFLILSLNHKIVQSRENAGNRSMKILDHYFERKSEYEPVEFFRGNVKFHRSMLLPTMVRQNFQRYLAKLLTYDDQLIIEKITGFRFHLLLSGLEKVSESELFLILSDAQYIPHQLNKFGLHILRAMLAERIFDKKLIESKIYCPQFAQDIDKLLEYGIILKEFIPTKSMRYWMKQVQYGNKKRNLSFEYSDKTLGQLISCLYLPHELSTLYYENKRTMHFKVQKITHRKWDGQHLLHTDRIFSSLKLFATDEHISQKDGPLVLVKGSHRSSEKKLKFWHELIKEPAMAFKACPSGYTSFLPDQKSFISHLGYDKSNIEALTLPKFRVAIVNTLGFHRRFFAEGKFRFSWISAYGNTGTGEIFPKTNPFQVILESAAEMGQPKYY